METRGASRDGEITSRPLLIPDHVLNHPRFHDSRRVREQRIEEARHSAPVASKLQSYKGTRARAREELAEFLIRERATVKLKQAEIIPRVGKRLAAWISRRPLFPKETRSSSLAARLLSRVIVKLATPPVPFLREFFPRSSPLSSPPNELPLVLPATLPSLLFALRP